MLRMRPVLVVCIIGLVAASPAAAQPGTFESETLRLQQDAARRDAVNLSNELNALDARVRTEQALSDLRQQRQGVPVPQLHDDPPPRMGAVAPPATLIYPSTPDAILADSNRKVREASRPPR